MPKLFRATVVTVLVMILIVAIHHRSDKTQVCKEVTYTQTANCSK